MANPIVLFILKAIVPIVLAIYVEDVFFKSHFNLWYEPSTIASFLPKSYGIVIFMNIIVSTFLLQVLGVKVGAARTKYAEKAKKDGDADAETRFSLPKMYAEGFSQHAKEFNCIQRGHQQALETYTQFVVCSLIGGVTFPVATAAGGLLWNVARWKWAEGYASGDPAKRYDNIISRGIWFGLVMQLATASATACKVLGYF
jgi:glutathione S-transferase